jgi:enoyl-CoA hydratase/carnithine racemase
MGGGFMLAVACDIVVTGPDTRWQLPEIAHGWLPGWGLQTLSARVGPQVARRLSMSAELLDGREAHRLGVADHVAPDGETALQAALTHARAMARLSPHALASVKQFFVPQMSASGEVMDAWTAQLLAEDMRQPEGQASLAKFRRK